MKQKKIPVPEPRPDKYDLPVASNLDMTDLVPEPVDNREMRDSYSDIIPYRAAK